MAARAIIRDPEILSGRWRLAGTMVPIADVRRMGGDRAAIKRRYRDIQLTDEEIDAIRAFEFPAIRDPGVTVHPTTISIYCPCGEVTDIPNGESIRGDCPCGRSWRVSAAIELIEDRYHGGNHAR